MKGCPDALLPPGFVSSGAFGDAIGWGTYDESARQRAAAITLPEIQSLQLTVPIARSWLELYECVIRKTPRNPSARGRADLMRRIIGLLTEESEPEDVVPESFRRLVKELESLGLTVEVLSDEEEQILLADVIRDEQDEDA